MSCSEEATIWMSSSAMNMPTHMTTKGARLHTSSSAAQLSGGRAALWQRRHAFSRVRSRVHADRRRQARPQRPKHRVVVELDADGNALHDLGEVAGRVFGRDHAEDGAGGRGEADDMAVKDMVRQDVGDDRRGLSRRHSFELVLLEIGVDPKVMRRDDGGEIGAAGDIGADLGGAIADIAVDRRADFGVAQIELGGAEVGLRLRRRRPGPRRSLRPKPRVAALRRRARPWTKRRRPGRLIERDALSAFCRDPALESASSRYLRSSCLANSACAVFASRSAFAWRMIVCCSDFFASRLASVAFRAATIAVARSTAARKSRSSRRMSGWPARTWSLSADQDLGDEAGDVRRYRRDIAARVGVVGAFDEAPDGPPVVAVSRPAASARSPASPA